MDPKKTEKSNSATRLSHEAHLPDKHSQKITDLKPSTWVLLSAPGLATLWWGLPRPWFDAWAYNLW